MHWKTFEKFANIVALFQDKRFHFAFFLAAHKFSRSNTVCIDVREREREKTKKFEHVQFELETKIMRRERKRWQFGDQVKTCYETIRDQIYRLLPLIFFLVSSMQRYVCMLIVAFDMYVCEWVYFHELSLRIHAYAPKSGFHTGKCSFLIFFEITKKTTTKRNEDHSSNFFLNSKQYPCYLAKLCRSKCNEFQHTIPDILNV